MRYIFLQLPAHSIYSIYLERCGRCEVKNAIILLIIAAKKMIESEYKRFLCDGLIQSSAERVHNLRKIVDDIPRLIEWQGVRISANNRALDPCCLLTRQMPKKAQCD